MTVQRTPETFSPILWLRDVMAQAQAAGEAADKISGGPGSVAETLELAECVSRHAADAANAAEELLTCFRPQSDEEAAILGVLLTSRAGFAVHDQLTASLRRELQRLSAATLIFIDSSHNLPAPLRTTYAGESVGRLWFVGDPPMTSGRVA